MKTLLITIVLLLSGMVYGQNKYTEMFNEANASLYERQDSIITPKDTFINDFDNWGETNKNPYLWWNAATWTMIDSTGWYYQARERLKSYQTYIDHCYADSVIQYRYKTEYWNGMGWSTKYTYDPFVVMESNTSVEISPIYKHRKPTFEGYVKWLEKLLL